MLIKNNIINFITNVLISIIRLFLQTLNRIKSLLPLNLVRLNKNYLFALIDSQVELLMNIKNENYYRIILISNANPLFLGIRIFKGFKPKCYYLTRSGT